MKLLFTEYTRTQCRDLFDGQVVSPVLPYSYKRECLAGCDEEAPGSVSVSGAQQKMAVVAEAGRLRFAREGETGTHILKPSPQRFALSRDIPANEALCMRICRELFRLPTAASALCFFSDGVPAYLTRRFDLMPMGGKAHMEDFASLSNMEMHGSSNRKYHGSYEQLAEVLKSCSTTPLLDLRRFFCMVLANYLLCNGDAHAKNFSMRSSTKPYQVLKSLKFRAERHLKSRTLSAVSTLTARATVRSSAFLCEICSITVS